MQVGAHPRTIPLGPPSAYVILNPLMVFWYFSLFTCIREKELYSDLAFVDLILKYCAPFNLLTLQQYYTQHNPSLSTKYHSLTFRVDLSNFTS